MSFLPDSFTAAYVLNQPVEAAPVEAPETALPEGNVECDGCSGDGVYYGRGSVVNGVFQGFTGTCYRCGGKGAQTPADVKRNTYYDNRVRRIAG